jgi:hypothetical protein
MASNPEDIMNTNINNSNNHDQYHIANYYPDGKTCDICKRNVSELEPHTETFAEIHKNLRKNFSEKEFPSILGGNDHEVHYLLKTWRSLGTDNVGSSRECKDCIKLSDQVATVQSLEAYLREQVKKVCNDVGCDYLSPIVIDQQYSPQQYDMCLREQKSMEQKNTESGVKSSILLRSIIKGMITKQKNGFETVFIINGPPLNASCTICGKKADELQPFDQSFINDVKETEKRLGGDLSPTHCICPYITADNKLAKNSRYLSEIGPESTWECTNCFGLSGKAVFEMFNSRTKR